MSRSEQTRIAPPPQYPPAPKGRDTREVNGRTFPEPYRWLEDTASARTAEWLAAQAALTDATLANTQDRRDAAAFLARQPKSIPVMRLDSTPFSAAMRIRRGARWFYFDDIVQTQAKLYVAGAADQPGRRVPLAGETPYPLIISPSGRYAVYGLTSSGLDAPGEIRIHDLVAGTDLDERLAPSASFEASWRHDELGFYYSHAPATPLSESGGEGLAAGVYFHELGRPQSEDECIVSGGDDPAFLPVPNVSPDGEWLAIANFSFWAARTTSVAVRPLGSDDPFSTLIDVPEGYAIYLGSRGGESVFVTDADAPNGRVIAVDHARPDPGHWREVVAESAEPIARYRPGALGQAACLAGDTVFVTTVRDGHHQVRAASLDGSRSIVAALPGLPHVSHLEPDGPDACLIGHSSYLTPVTTTRFDVTTGQTTMLHQVDPGPELREIAERCTEELRFVEADDGVRIPLSVVRPNEPHSDAEAPCLLYVYGGYGNVFTADHCAEVLLWLRGGGVYVNAHVRGGGEYGPRWAEAGRGAFGRRRVIADVRDVARALIEDGLASPRRLGLLGDSGGGQCVSAVYNHHPELFGAVVSTMEVADLFRAILDRPFGERSRVEFGDPLASPEERDALAAISPLHGVQADGPPILLVVGDADQIVAPEDVYKHAAALQAANPERMALLRVVPGGGHQFWPVPLNREACADIYAFLRLALGSGNSAGASVCE